MFWSGRTASLSRPCDSAVTAQSLLHWQLPHPERRPRPSPGTLWPSLAILECKARTSLRNHQYLASNRSAFHRTPSSFHLAIIASSKTLRVHFGLSVIWPTTDARAARIRNWEASLRWHGAGKIIHYDYGSSSVQECRSEGQSRECRGGDPCQVPQSLWKQVLRCNALEGKRDSCVSCCTYLSLYRVWRTKPMQAPLGDAIYPHARTVS